MFLLIHYLSHVMLFTDGKIHFSCFSISYTCKNVSTIENIDTVLHGLYLQNAELIDSFHLTSLSP